MKRHYQLVPIATVCAIWVSNINADDVVECDTHSGAIIYHKGFCSIRALKAKRRFY